VIWGVVFDGSVWVVKGFWFFFLGFGGVRGGFGVGRGVFVSCWPSRGGAPIVGRAVLLFGGALFVGGLLVGWVLFVGGGPWGCSVMGPGFVWGFCWGVSGSPLISSFGVFFFWGGALSWGGVPGVVLVLLGAWGH